MGLERAEGERVRRARRREQRPRRWEQVVLATRPVADRLERVEQQVAVETDGADPEKVGVRFLDARGDRREVPVAELVLEIEQHLETPGGRDLARPRGDELDRGELAGDDRDGLRRLSR